METAATIAEKLGVKPAQVRYELDLLRAVGKIDHLRVGQTWAYPDTSLDMVRNRINRRKRRRLK